MDINYCAETKELDKLKFWPCWWRKSKSQGIIQSITVLPEYKMNALTKYHGCPEVGEAFTQSHKHDPHGGPIGKVKGFIHTMNNCTESKRNPSNSYWDISGSKCWTDWSASRKCVTRKKMCTSAPKSNSSHACMLILYAWPAYNCSKQSKDSCCRSLLCFSLRRKYKLCLSSWSFFHTLQLNSVHFS